MAEHRQRRDSYGKPLPTLADVREQSLSNSPANREAWRFLQEAIQDTCHPYLHRGKSIYIMVSFDIADGVIQKKVWLRTRRRYSEGIAPPRPEGER